MLRPPHGDGVSPVFVYGTLMPGEELWPVVASGVRSRIRARVRGALHFHEEGRWPLLCPDPTGWVVGELLGLDDDAVSAAARVELTAGYEARWLATHALDGDPGTQLGAALVFVWPWGADQRGPRIASGDWSQR